MIGKIKGRSPYSPVLPEREDRPVAPLNTKVTNPLKNLSNFPRSLSLPFINAESRT